MKNQTEKYLNLDDYRIYRNYINGNLNNKYISATMLENINYDYILNCFIDDVIKVKSMLDEYLSGTEIDYNKFDMLCDHLSPIYWSDAAYEDEGDGIINSLSVASLPDYKERHGRVKLSISEGYEEDEIFKLDLFFPNCDYLVLIAANNKNIDILQKYLSILNKKEINELLEQYYIIVKRCHNFDLSKDILKYIETCI